MFKPANGAWGLQGSTLVQLKSADTDDVHEAMKAAWLGRAPKKVAERFRRGGLQAKANLSFS
ncbi:MAG: hypothetical protein ACLQVL_20285 [Terriglobia bacterium]